MKKLIIIILALFAFAVPAFAKEDPCPPDLDPYITAMQDLQAEFDETGDITAFTNDLQQIIVNLENLHNQCSPFQEVQVEHFAVSYPKDWVEETQNDDIIVFGTSLNVLDALGSESPMIPSGEIGVGVFVDVTEIFGDLPPNSEEPLRDFADLLLDELSDDSGFTFNEPVYFAVNDRRALRVDFSDESFDASIIVVHLGDENYTIIVPITAAGEFQSFEPTLMEILNSARYIP